MRPISLARALAAFVALLVAAGPRPAWAIGTCGDGYCLTANGVPTETSSNCPQDCGDYNAACPLNSCGCADGNACPFDVCSNDDPSCFPDPQCACGILISSCPSGLPPNTSCDATTPSIDTADGYLVDSVDEVTRTVVFTYPILTADGVPIGIVFRDDFTPPIPQFTAATGNTTWGAAVGPGLASYDREIIDDSGYVVQRWYDRGDQELTANGDGTYSPSPRNGDVLRFVSTQQARIDNSRDNTWQSYVLDPTVTNVSRYRLDSFGDDLRPGYGHYVKVSRDGNYSVSKLELGNYITGSPVATRTVTFDTGYLPDGVPNDLTINDDLTHASWHLVYTPFAPAADGGPGTPSTITVTLPSKGAPSSGGGADAGADATVDASAAVLQEFITLGSLTYDGTNEDGRFRSIQWVDNSKDTYFREANLIRKVDHIDHVDPDLGTYPALTLNRCAVSYDQDTVQVVYPDDLTESYEIVPAGTPGERHRWKQLDALGRLTTYTYYPNGLVNTITYPISGDGSQTVTITAQYDPATDELTTVTDSLGHTFYGASSFTPDGMPQQVTLRNGTSRLGLGWDPTLGLARITKANGDESKLVLAPRPPGDAQHAFDVQVLLDGATRTTATMDVANDVTLNVCFNVGDSYDLDPRGRPLHVGQECDSTGSGCLVRSTLGYDIGDLVSTVTPPSDGLFGPAIATGHDGWLGTTTRDFTWFDSAASGHVEQHFDNFGLRTWVAYNGNGMRVVPTASGVLAGQVDDLDNVDNGGSSSEEDDPDDTCMYAPPPPSMLTCNPL